MRAESSLASTSDHERWGRLAALALVWISGAFVLAIAGLSLTLSLSGRGANAGEWSERGVTLGMTEAQVRRSFIDGPAGAWTTATACGGPALEWIRREPGVPTRWARFELHDGWIGAMRLHIDGRPGALHAEQTSYAVRQERPYQGGVSRTVIARGCSTHAAEVQQIALAAAVSSLAWGRRP